jgi:hypothetical protein
MKSFTRCNWILVLLVVLLVGGCFPSSCSSYVPDEWYLSKLAHYEKLREQSGAGDVSEDQITESCSARRSCGECCGYGSIESDADVAARYGLDSWYEKVLNFRGFIIASSAITCDAALYEAALTLDRQIEKRPDFLAALMKDGVHMAVLASIEKTTEVPEYSVLDSSFDTARGLGATSFIPVTSCAEEGLLCLAGDPYQGENLCVHENAHSLTGSARKLRTTRYNIPGDRSSGELFASFEDAYEQSVMSDGLWSNTYATTNADEYMAEGVQSFYNANMEGSSGGDGIHNTINTRAELEDYDVRLYNLLATHFSTRTTSFPCPRNSACDCSRFRCPGTSGSVPDWTPAPTTTNSTPAPPSSAPPAGNTSSTSCFSEESTVQVLHKGTVTMKDLQVGDHILTGTRQDHTNNHHHHHRSSDNYYSIYQPVYAFGHRNENKTAEFLRISTSSSLLVPEENDHGNKEASATFTIEMTSNHLLYLADKEDAIRADSIQIGDSIFITHHLDEDEDSLLMTQQPQPVRHVVTRIERVVRRGIYQPLTPDGTLIVSGIPTSAYVSLRDYSSDFVDQMQQQPFVFLSDHTILHWWLAPLRMLCLGVSLHFCQDHHGNNDGLLHWFAVGEHLLVWFDQSNAIVQSLLVVLYVTLTGFLRLVEIMLGHSLGCCLVLWIMMSGAMFLVRGVQRREPRRGGLLSSNKGTDR